MSVMNPGKESSNFLQFLGVEECGFNEVIGIEFDFLDVEPVEVHLPILYSPGCGGLFQVFGVLGDEISQRFFVGLLEYFQCLFQ